MNDSPDALARRARQERALAEASGDPAARRVHFSLAQFYENRLALAGGMSGAVLAD